jgi:hypothetical protein
MSSALRMPHHESPADWVQQTLSEVALDKGRELVIVKHTQPGESYLSYDMKVPDQAPGLPAEPISYPLFPPEHLRQMQIHVPGDLRADHGGNNPNALHVLLVVEQTTKVIPGGKSPITENRPVKVIEYTRELALPARW